MNSFGLGALVVFTDHLLCIGKSSLTVRFVEHHFVESYYPTIENTFSRIIKHNGQDSATEIIDTAGQVGKTVELFVLKADVFTG